MTGSGLANFFRTVIAVAVGVVLGLGATWAAVERGLGFGAVVAGPWTGWPMTGSADADPYARAAMARSGEVPLGLAEGLTFIARTDDAGAALDPRCDYTVTSPVPTARFWTLTAMTQDGALLGAGDERHGFTSSEIVRDGDGRFAIVLSREARAGAWLPIAGAAPFALMLRLYDTPTSSAASALTGADMPRIVKGACA